MNGEGGTWTGIVGSFEKRGSHHGSLINNPKSDGSRDSATTTGTTTIADHHPDFAQRGSMGNGMRVNNETVLRARVRAPGCV